MNIPTISTLDITPSGSATGIKGTSETASGSSDGSFSDILTRQHDVESARTKSSSPSSPVKATIAPNDKAADRKLATESSLEEDDALTLLANDHALSLPQLAIQIASQAAAVQSADAKGLPLTEPAGKTSRTANSLVAALAAGNAAVKTPILPAQENTAADPRFPATGRDISANAGKDFLKQADPKLPQGSAENDALIATTITARPTKQTVEATQALAPSQTPEQSKLKTTAADFLATLANTAHSSKNETSTQIDTMGASQTAALAASVASSTSANGQPATAGINMLNTGAQAVLPGITLPLQSPQWASDFGRHFMSIAQGGQTMPHTAELRLDPPDLGPLRITINISDNVAHAVFVSPHAYVRQTVENALPQLQQLLAQAGISLGQTSVNDQGQPGQSFNESANGQGPRSAAASASARSTGSASDIAAIPVARALAPNALVDTFA